MLSILGSPSDGSGGPRSSHLAELLTDLEVGLLARVDYLRTGVINNPALSTPWPSLRHRRVSDGRTTGFMALPQQTGDSERRGHAGDAQA